MKKNQLKIEVNQDGSRYTMSAGDTPLSSTEQADFWRIMMDDEYYREVMIPSHLQSGTTEIEGDTTVIRYPQLIDGTGRVFLVEFTVYITKTEDSIKFHSKLHNLDDARVNEVQLPFLDFASLCDENRENDTLYRSRGMGERIRNPWKALEKSHTEYMSADYHEIWSPLLYPRPCNMAWMGLETAGRFLYIGRHDQPAHTCTFNVGINPRHTDPRLIFTVCHYPLALKGETLETAKVVAALAEGDWRDGSKRYKEWADSSWYQRRKKTEWVRSFTGWQRIILRHQYGEIFWKYKDLVRVFEDGMKYGIDTMMVFGWWKGRFDNGYPLYEPDDALGGEDELKKAIREIQSRGGKVILYTNGVLMDVKSEFYQQYGKDTARIDIDGNPYLDHYQFSNQGTILRNFGYKTFAEACQGTESWKQRLIHNGKVKLAMKPDSIFFDQIGGHHCWLCFNPKHKHGNRGDLDPAYRIENFKALNDLLSEKEALGTENTVDIFTPYMDYHHGCDFGNWYAANAYPQLYLNTFPDTIITNRFIHDEREDYILQLNYAFTFGFRYDVCLYRGRLVDLDEMKGYATHLKKLLDLKEKYHRFFYPSHLVMKELLPLPDSILMAQYEADGELLTIFLNCSKEAAKIIYHGEEYSVGGYGILYVYHDHGEQVED